MNVNNKVELNSINNKLEFSSKQKSINNITQKLFGQDAFKVDSSNRNQIFKMGENNMEDIMEALASEPSDFVKGALVALGKTTTSKDLSKLNEEGYDVEDDDVDTIVTVTDKIQIYLATHCEDYQVVGDVSKEAIEAVSGNSAMAMEIAKKLQESNLPITKDNVEETKEAIDLAMQLQQISDGAAKYLINNALAPTIENVYKAEFSGLSSVGGTYGAGFFCEGTGYLGKTSDEFNWDSLKEQMSKVIESAGLEVNEDTLSKAKWLMENHIPLTKESISQYEELKNISFPVSAEEVLESIMQAIQEGKRPSQALLTEGQSFLERAKEAYQVIQNTTDENIKSVIAKELPITINNLKNEQRVSASDDSNTTTSTIEVNEDNISFITARRQLEEIRLQMSVEANYRLLKQGISIETTQLQTLINELKSAEELYYKQLFQNSDVEATTENISTFKDISTKLTEIKSVPSDVLGKVVSGETQNTINAIHKTGTEIKSTYAAAEKSYEALMTKPRSDMGDKITKAFQNVDDILTDMGLDTTKANQRAVRILGYNSMEITLDNINAVKAADQAVNETMSSLTPKVVLNMIREGINPLDTNIDELNRQISQMKDAIGDETQEKYSEFLWKLEKNSEISEEERKTFIGVYRLLNNVEKTDGQVIGALVNQNADLTLKNLLTGVRNIKNRGIDVKVDDNFGELESLTFKSTSISDQLQASFHNESDSQSNDHKQESVQIDYYNNLVKQALRDVSPDKLAQVVNDEDFLNMTLEELVDKIATAKENSVITESYYNEQLELIQKAAQVEKNVIEMLTDNNQPVTINNIFAAEALMNKRGSMFQKLTSQSENEELNNAINDIDEALSSKEELQIAYEKLERAALSTIDEQAEKADVTSIDLKELKLLRSEIKLSTNLSKQEKYEIPVRIGDEITSINLTVIRGVQSGKVAITMENETIGKAVAEFTLKENNVNGYVAVDNQEGLTLLEGSQDEFKLQLESLNLSLGKLDFIKSNSLDINHLKNDVATQDSASEVSTANLYQTAKAFVVYLKSCR